MLHTQNYLRAFSQCIGPEQLKEELGINYRYKDGKYIFAYNQFDSPKLNDIVKECRGLILYEGSWDIASHSFDRFFNYGESGADIIPDLSKCRVLPKLDGTMCNLYWDRNTKHWHMATRSMIDGDGPVGEVSTKTFGELFWETFLYTPDNFPGDKSCTYTFELTSPLNRVVTLYKENELTLLTIRDNITNREHSYIECFNFAGNHLDSKQSMGGIVRPVPMDDWQELLKMQGLIDTDEGFVVLKEGKEGSHKRIKVKNPAYLTIAHLIEGPSEKHFLELIQRGSADEFLSYYPEYKEHLDKLQVGLKLLVEKLKEDYISIHSIENRKDFALQATQKMFPGVMFAMRDGKITNLAIDLLLMPVNNLLDMIHRVNTGR